MISVFVGLLFGTGFLLAHRIFNPPQKGPRPEGNSIKKMMINSLNLAKYENQAEAIGWKIRRKELCIIIALAVTSAVAVAVLTNNPFVFIAGIITGSLAPKMVIEKKRQCMRINLLTKLTDPLRMLLSRLPEQQNITRVVEMTRDETADGQIRCLLDGYLREVALGGSVRDALLGMKNKVKLRKFDIVAENLVQAHYDGFTAEAFQALEKAIEAIEFDLRAIEKVKQVSQKKKQSLYTALGVSWSFIPILSLLRNTEVNIYLDTIPGKILILLYVLATIYIIVKGEEYLNLNLDEL